MINKIINWLLGSFFRTIGRILAFLLIAFGLFYFFSTKEVKAAANQDFSIKYNGYNFDNSTFYLSTNGENTWFSIENETTYTMAELFEFGDYGKLAICSTGEVTNVYPRNDNVKNISFYNTGASCNLNNTPGYKGKIIYITFEVNWTTTNASEFCGSSNQYCLYNLEIANYWQTGGYLQLISYSFSKQPFIYDDTNDTIINQNNQTNNKLDETNDLLGGEDTDTTSGKCGVVCKLKGIFTGIIELPGKIISLLIDALKSLFIPEDMSFITDLVDSLEEKLGFIAEVPITMIEFMLELVTMTWEEMTTITFPTIEVFGYYFWEEQVIDVTPIIDKLKPYRYITNMLCVGLCVATLQRWYNKFNGGGGS